MKALLHICCAPCSVQCIQSLRGEGIEPFGFWYNPNIHPFTEYDMRKKTFIEYAKSISLELFLQDEYGLRMFVNKIYPDFTNRCETCYDLRMEAAAQYAKANGFDAFTTTLLISPYQNHDLLRLRGEAAAEKEGVQFLYRDFRPLFRLGQRQARELGLYMQKYCGCVFSEEERYTAKKEKHTNTGGPNNAKS